MVSVAVLIVNRKQSVLKPSGGGPSSLLRRRAVAANPADGQIKMCRLEGPRHRYLKLCARQVDVVNPAAIFAVEMAMLVHVRAESRGASIQIHLLDQATLHQNVKTIVNHNHRNI